MALTAASIQTFIDNLETTYNTLTQEHAQSRSAAGRSQVLVQMEAVRKEIDAWVKVLDSATRAARSFTQGRPVR